jgi:PAS domain S-box-containing protein
MNAGGIIQSASDSVEDAFGWTPTELFGRSFSVLVPEPRRSDLDRYLDRYRNPGRAKVLRRALRFDAMHKDGTVFPIELSVSRADLPTHAAPFFVGIIRDVSQLIDVGEGPPDDHSRLQNLITEQTRALVTANLRLHLADRLASLGTLAAGLGHDMNNVLLPVRARLNAVEHAGIPAEARAHLAAVRRSLAYLQQLSDGLHYLAVDPDGPDVASEGKGTTHVGHWWRQVGSLLRKAVPGHVKLTASWPAALPAIAVAPHWLTQAVLNLIVNAGEAIPSDRKRPPGRIRLWAEMGADRAVRLGVSDNGRGMTQAVQRRAFDLFFTTKSRGMGTGLGLPLARKVAQRAGGDIELRSAHGRGTAVVLVLPAAPSGPRAGSGAPSKMTAAITIRRARTRALVSQVLHGAGLAVAGDDGGPGRSEVWVTEPTAATLRAARAWRRPRSARSLIVVGGPARAARVAWDSLGATIIDADDDFESIRDAVAHAAGPTPSGG